jgi:hypothetical protein
MKPLPRPDLESQPITYQEFLELVPEKFELVDGYLFDPPYRPQWRERLLSLLLTNEGLVQAVGMFQPMSIGRLVDWETGKSVTDLPIWRSQTFGRVRNAALSKPHSSWKVCRKEAYYCGRDLSFFLRTVE